MLTRQSVEALRERMLTLSERLNKIAPVSYENRVAESREVVALCDHYLSTPAAEPTAGDARDIRAAAEKEADAFGPFSNDRTTAPIHRLAIVRAFEAFAIAQRQARPSLGAAADGEGVAWANRGADGDALPSVDTAPTPTSSASQEVSLQEIAAYSMLGDMAVKRMKRELAELLDDAMADAVLTNDRPIGAPWPIDGIKVIRNEILPTATMVVSPDVYAAIRASSPDAEGGRET